MTDTHFDKTLPLSAIRLLMQEELAQRLEKAPIDKVLKDLKTLSKLIIVNESTGDAIEYRGESLNQMNEEELKNILEGLSMGNTSLQQYLRDYFHQGGFQNYAEGLMSNFFSNQCRLLTKTGSRGACFTIKRDGTLHFEESYDISAIKDWSDNMDGDEKEFSIGTVGCHSVFTIKNNEQVDQDFGEVKLTAKPSQLSIVFSNMFENIYKTNEYVEYLLSTSAKNRLEKIQKSDPGYYKELCEKYQLTPEKVGCYALFFYKKSNLSKEHTNFSDFLRKNFSDDIYMAPIDGYVKYLIEKQSYAINTVNAAAGMPVVRRALGVYRHGYIQIYDSPFKNGKSKENKNHEILELNPIGQTNELKAKSVTGQIRVVPGLVTMALHLAGNERLKTGQYKLINYRPWVNDCQTYFKHTQEMMNKMLLEIDPESGHALQQEVINHYRYRPGMSKKDAEWLRRQAGLQLAADKKFFGVSKRGLHYLVPPTKEKTLKPIEKDFRNAVVDREKTASPSDHTLRNVGWLIKQFAKSSIERVKKHVKYKKIELTTKGKVHKIIKLLRKKEGFLQGMKGVLAIDSLKVKLPAMLEKQYIAYYKEIMEPQDAWLKNKEKLSGLLKKLESNPFDTELNIAVNHLRNEILQGMQQLKKGVFNLHHFMDEQPNLFVQEKKYMLDAMKVLEKTKNELDLKITDILMCGVKKEGTQEEITPLPKKLNTEVVSTLPTSLPNLPDPMEVFLLAKNLTSPLATLQSVERKIESFLNNITQRYAQSMANPAEKLWGGDIEIQLLGEIKNLKIYVHHANAARKPDALGSSKATNAIHILYSNGNHYDVCDAEGEVTQKTVPDGNCLFESVIRGEKKLLKMPTEISASSMNSKISDLRKEVGEILLKNHAAIESGSAFHQPVGFKGEAVKLLKRDDMVWVRFNAVFESEHELQLHEALSLLPDGVLKTEARSLKRELDRVEENDVLEKMSSLSLGIRKK